MAGDHSKKAVLVAVSANGLITVAKFVGWFLTRSPSLMAESIHSLADTANQILLLIGIQTGAKAPTQKHPWGHGQARYFWNLISATGVFFIGFGVTTYHGVHALVQGPGDHVPGQGLSIGIWILVLSFLLEGWSWWVAFKEIKRQAGNKSIASHLRTSQDPTTIGIFFEDSIAVSGVIVALLGIWLSQWTHSHIPDALASIVIGCLLGVMAVDLARINGRLLINVALPAPEEAEIHDFIQALPDVEEIRNLKTTVLGPGQVALHLEVEFHGGLLVSREALIEDAKEIESGEPPLQVLVDAAERAVRQVGRRTQQIEKLIMERFPTIVVISLEVL